MWCESNVWKGVWRYGQTAVSALGCRRARCVVKYNAGRVAVKPYFLFLLREAARARPNPPVAPSPVHGAQAVRTRRLQRRVACAADMLPCGEQRQALRCRCVAQVIPNRRFICPCLKVFAVFSTTSRLFYVMILMID